MAGMCISARAARPPTRLIPLHEQGYFGRTEASLVPLEPPGYPELYRRPAAFFPEPAPPIADRDPPEPPEQ